MNLFFSAIQRIKHFLKAKGANGIHSPFVFEFYNLVLNHPYNFYAFNEIEDERDKLLVNNKWIEYQDIGAKKRKIKIKISQLAAKSLMPQEKDVFLFQLCHWLKPDLVLELGTCLGITTAYLAKAYPAQIVTFEGITPISSEAKTVWNNLKINNIKLVEGPIENTLPVYLKAETKKINLAIVDANHSYGATIDNFQRLLPAMADSGCIVFDDIYWSIDMAKAWDEIKQNEAVSVSIDLFHFGIVFFRKENQKENFIVHW